MSIPAFYFDGKTSRRFHVRLSVEAGIATLSGDIDRQCGLDQLRVSERMKNTPRKLTFPDGAYLEVLDNAAFNTLLGETGFQDAWVTRVQQSWHGALLASVAILLALVGGYLYGLPAASEIIAKALPEKVERAIGTETLQFLDRSIFAPSQLPAAQRDAIVERFKALTAPERSATSYQILFRKSKVGPNAFALPSGEIILTDEIIKLAGNDDAVMGILAHELGHLHERHLMRRMIQSTAIGAAAAALFGDVSSLLVSVPTLMLDLKYSRDAEREADRYAIAMLRANGISTSHLADAFEKLDSEAKGTAPYLSSHPPTAERIETIRGAR